MALEDGVYRARAIGWALGLTGTGKEQIGVELEVLDDGVSGQRITWFGYFTDKAFDVTLKALRTLGWRGTDLSDLRGLNENEVNIVVESEEYQGKYYPRVKWINPLGGGIPLKNQLDPSAAKAFAAKMKGRILAVEQANGRPAQQQRPQSHSAPQQTSQSYVGGPPEPPPHDDDDIPF